MIHGIGPLPSTIIKKGTAAKKKALSNAEKVRLNKLKNAANARKNKANRSKNAINASDVALARLLKKNKGARMSTGGIKKAQTGRTMDRGWQEPNSGMNDGSSSTPVMAKKGGIKKMEPGGPFKKMRNNILEKREQKAYDKYSQARSSASPDTGKLYDKLIKRQTKSINAGVNVKYKEGGSTDKKWIQKAINPKHKGYCTPMTKPTCTPKRKALAKTLKAMAKKK